MLTKADDDKDVNKDDTCVLVNDICSNNSNTGGGDDDDDEPNPPIWPTDGSVKIFYPDDEIDTIKQRIKPTQDSPQDQKWIDIDNNNKVMYNDFHSGRHFVDERFVLLFYPGAYEQLDFEVGYYVQVAGLGKKATDVVFKNCNYGPYVPALNKYHIKGNRPGLSLDTFWRSAENYKTEASYGQLWAVSQAAPLRRIYVSGGGNLTLHDKGAMASGGVVANTFVDGHIDFGSQQQFLLRSVEATKGNDKPIGGAWSLVFVDCVNNGNKNTKKNTNNKTFPPKPRNGKNEAGSGPSISIDDKTRITVEKPFIAIDVNDPEPNPRKKKFNLIVPRPRIRDENDPNIGPDLDGNNDDVRDFTNVKVVTAMKIDDYDENKQVPNGDIAMKINIALKDGKDILLTPGIYYLKEPLEIVHHNQVILGLGLATLVAPVDGRPCIMVSPKLEGVRIAGIMLEASSIPKDRKFFSSLLEWGVEGTTNDDPGNPQNPGVLTDIFARVGGSNLDRTVSTDVMVRIHSGNIYGDNLWLWRADHVELRYNEDPNVDGLDFHQVMEGECPVKTGIEVNGNDVTIHGLAVEHTTEHQTIWNGERGNVQFYQCEFPYDVTQDFAKQGYTGYLIHEDVTNHEASGVGVYSNFRDFVVPVPNAIVHPPQQVGDDQISVVNPFTVRLDNNGYIMNILNGKGDAAVIEGKPNRL